MHVTVEYMHMIPNKRRYIVMQTMATTVGTVITITILPFEDNTGFYAFKKGHSGRNGEMHYFW